jgi:hypothetical protein
LCTPRNFEHIFYINVYYFKVVILHYEYRTLRKFMFSHDFELSVTTVGPDSNVLRPANLSVIKIRN